jgi:peptidoglycan/LPS O-acetylase OafA/YrhL
MAATAVLIQHAMESCGLERIAQGAFALSVLNLGETGVAAFFFVSGFVIPLTLEKRGSIREFWVNRAFRIYPLYLFIFAVTSVITPAAFGGFPGFLKNLAAHLLFIQEYVHQFNRVGGSWTLSLEAVWYLSFCLLFCLGINKKNYVVAVLCLLISGVSIGFCLLNHHDVRLPLGRLNLLLYCAVGLFCLRRHHREISPRDFNVISTMMFAAIAANAVVGFLLRPAHNFDSPNLQCVAISGLLGASLFFVPFATRTSKMWAFGPLRGLGAISYSVYLVHPVVLSCFHLILGKNMPHPALFVAAVFLTTVAVSALTYNLIERPAIAFGKRLGRSTREAHKNSSAAVNAVS